MRYPAARFLLSGLVVASVFAAGCANVQPADPLDGVADFSVVRLGDGGAADAGVAVDGATDLAAADAATAPDLVAVELSQPPDLLAADLWPAPDLHPRVDLLAPVDLLTPPVGDMAPACALRINEVLTSTPTSGYDEFVEVYNPCHQALAKYTLVYRSAGNTGSAAAANDTTTLYTFTATPPASAGAYLVFGGSAFPTSKEYAPFDKDGIADDGAVGLRDGSGNLVDSVAFGTVASGNAFVRTKAAAGSNKGQSVSRVHDGVDSGNNSVDFHLASPTPQATND